MWRKNGKGVLYLYDMDKKEVCGDDYPLTIKGKDFSFIRGTWHHVAERLKIITCTAHNGEVEVCIDGQHAALLKGLQFVNNGSKVDNLYFSTFHGGNSKDWAPVNDSLIWFDDIMIRTNHKDIFR